VSAVHTLLSLQSSPGPGWHTPVWHESAVVQTLPSLQAVPFGAAGFEQAPDCGSHVPATWHGSLAVQVTGFDPTQAPA
jgi:hypothetical protein